MPAPGRAGGAARRADVAAADADLLGATLAALSGREDEIVDRFYALFFGRHPEVRPLFGEHSVSEREEMVRETFVSVLAHADEEAWLDENLKAMGRSHAEYGVEGHSYPDFVVAMLDTLEEVGPEGWDGASRAAWERALCRITGVMRAAGAAHGAG